MEHCYDYPQWDDLLEANILQTKISEAWLP